MRLRARLACLILILLFIPILSMSLISLDYIVGQMIEDLARSTDLVGEQIFEQIREPLMQGNGDLATALHNSKSLARLLISTQAFGPSVVSASILSVDGTVLVAANGEGEGKPAPVLPPLSKLEARASGWWLFASIPDLMSANVYESRREVMADGKPVAIISIGVTTALIAERARHLLLVILMTAAAVTAIAWLAISLVANRILFQVAALTRGIEQLAAGRTAVEVEVEGRDELSALAAKFNELSRQVRSDRSRLDHDQTHLFDVVRSIQDAVLMLDANGVVLFANKAARERIAPRAASLEGTPLESALGDDHALVTLVKTTLETGTEAHDVPVQLRDGVSFLVSFFRMGQGHKPTGLLIVLRDLKPVIELESALDSSNRLARLGTLISGMAHQLRSPLHGMNLRLELLREDHSEGATRHIDKLRQDVTRLDQAIEAILRFTRPADLKVTDFSINEMLTDIGSRVKTERIDVEYDLDAALSLVRADRGMIAEALTNLVTNSVQAMTQGGKLTLATRANATTAEIEVADQGVGIPKDKLERIFDLYYTTKPGGSGLGLPFAMRAIELNHGKITLRSEVAKGTVCTIALPMAVNASPRAITASTT
jgi:signal transduction histidine kinase/HAMP domain-containing protein